MEKKQVELGHPVVVSGLTIIPVTQTVIHAWPENRPYIYLGLKRPLYILVRNPQQPLQSFTSEGVSISPEQIQREYPEIKNELENLLH